MQGNTDFAVCRKRVALARRKLYLAWMERASPLSIYLTAVLFSIIAELATDCAHAHTECLQYDLAREERT